eukprot:scaffold2910_cov390-Prasinococcus_capsulatus_cf.AAC.27
MERVPRTRGGRPAIPLGGGCDNILGVFSPHVSIRLHEGPCPGRDPGGAGRRYPVPGCGHPVPAREIGISGCGGVRYPNGCRRRGGP